MNRILVNTIHVNTQPFWLFKLIIESDHQEFCVYSPDLDTAIYEVLTHTNTDKSTIVSISKH